MASSSWMAGDDAGVAQPDQPVAPRLLPDQTFLRAQGFDDPSSLENRLNRQSTIAFIMVNLAVTLPALVLFVMLVPIGSTSTNRYGLEDSLGWFGILSMAAFTFLFPIIMAAGGWAAVIQWRARRAGLEIPKRAAHALWLAILGCWPTVPMAMILASN